MYSKYIMFSKLQPEPVTIEYSTYTSPEKSTLGYATNNVHPELPPRMTDSRSLIASYQPEAIVNNTLLKNSNVKTNWEYRKFLTENSQKIAKDNFREACNDVGYFERFLPDERGYSSNTHGTPSNHLLYKNQGTLLNENSDLKELYLTRDELNDKFQPVTFTQDQIFSNLAK